MILKFLKKHFKKIYLLLPLLLGQQDNIIIVILVLLLFYLHSNSKIFKKMGSKIHNKINKNEKNVSNEIFNDIENNEINKENDEETNKNIIIEEKNKKYNENMDKLKNLTENIVINIDKVKKNNKTIKENMEFTPYINNRREIKRNYSEKPDKHDFSINVNSSVCSIPIFNLRTFNELDFYFNFIIHNYDSKKIHNLILCKDIHKWMNNSTLSDQDISNELVPVYFILKKNNKIDAYEYLKIFIHNGEDGKIAFVQKGNDYLIIDKYINELIDKEIVNDLLDGKMYTSYNLYSTDGVNDFLQKFLSLVLISENSIGEEVQLDIENYYENKSSYEYFFNTINADSSVFNTTI